MRLLFHGIQTFYGKFTSLEMRWKMKWIITRAVSSFLLSVLHIFTVSKFPEKCFHEIQNLSLNKAWSMFFPKSITDLFFVSNIQL